MTVKHLDAPWKILCAKMLQLSNAKEIRPAMLLDQYEVRASIWYRRYRLAEFCFHTSGLFDVGKSEEVKSFPKPETSENSGDLLGRSVGVILFPTCGNILINPSCKTFAKFFKTFMAV